jgi:hypothetical protein
VSHFKKGSKVNFVLDLTGSGTLCASVNDKPTVELFSNILSERDEDDSVGFVPVASLCRPGQVRFLRFEL